MRILVTGCTAMQVDSPRKINHLISNLESLIACLRYMGHEVDWKEVNLGDTLAEYDIVFCSLAPFASWGTRYMGGVLWALMNHPRVYLTADDWQVRGIFPSCAALAKRTDYFEKTIWSHWAKTFGPEHPYKETLKRAIRTLAHNHWPWKMIVPCWDGGDLSLLRLPADELYRYDPFPFMKLYDVDLTRQKWRRWVFASLTNKEGWLKKQDFSWPVAKYGNVRLGQEKVTEDHLQVIYDLSWGVISPPHNVSGSGWFRVRYHMAARSGCVLFGGHGQEESLVFGGSKSNPYVISAREVEKMTDAQLAVLASDQYHRLAQWSWSKEMMADHINNFITEI